MCRGLARRFTRPAGNCCISCRWRLRPTVSPSTSPCRAIAINWISASSPGPTSFPMCRCFATCCRTNSPPLRRPMRRRRQTSKARPAESRFTMIEMPALQFANTNGIRMGFYEAGQNTDTPPVILCHGWPEIAFSWRHQIKALSETGIRVIAPDQRGYGATARPESVESYDIEHLTGDLVGLLDHLKIDKAIFVGHDWGGFVVWQMPLRHIDRVAGVVGINTPHTNRAWADPIELLRVRFGDQMYIVQFQDPARGPDKIFGSRVEQTFDAFMRKPVPRSATAPAEQPVAGVGASPRLTLAFPQMIAGYDAKHDPRTPILSPEEKKVFVDTFP